MSTTIENEQIMDTDDYFLLIAAPWDNQTQDYSALKDSSLKYFDNFPDAEKSFNNADAFPELKGKDIKLDLIHVRYGINRFLLSRIVI